MSFLIHDSFLCTLFLPPLPTPLGLSNLIFLAHGAGFSFGPFLVSLTLWSIRGLEGLISSTKLETRLIIIYSTSSGTKSSASRSGRRLPPLHSPQVQSCRRPRMPRLQGHTLAGFVTAPAPRATSSTRNARSATLKNCLEAKAQFAQARQGQRATRVPSRRGSGVKVWFTMMEGCSRRPTPAAANEVGRCVAPAPDRQL